MKLLVRTDYTDVDVMAIINIISEVNNIKLDELWLAFGAGVHFWLQSTLYGWHSPSVPFPCRVRHRLFICRHRKIHRTDHLGCILKFI